MSYLSTTLPSGLKVVYRPTSSAVLYLGIAIGVGTRHESPRYHGLAHFTEHMLFKGTRLRKSAQIIHRLEQVGGELNAYTSKEETILYGLVPRAYYYRALQLMADIVRHSQFDPTELSKEQTVVMDEIASYEDSPSDLIWDEFENILFRSHPLGHSILGTEASVGRITSEVERKFFRHHYRPDNMVVFVQGKVDYECLVAHCQELLGREASAPRPISPSPIATPPLPLSVPRQTVRLKDTHQRHVLIGGYGYSRHDKRRLALSILVNLLGGPGMSSRLNMSLREGSGLVYHVECSYTAYADTGLVGIYFGCAPRSMKAAIALVEEELRRLVSAPLSPHEIEATKRQLKGQLIVAEDGPEQTFLSLGKAFLHHGKAYTLEETCRRIDAVSREELFAVAQEIFAPERMYRLIYK